MLTCLNSLGYIGSPSGISVLFYYLKKKSILLNSFINNFINDNNTDHESKFNKHICKKIKINNTKQLLSLNNYTSVADLSYDEIVIENSFEEILHELNNFLLNKN
jgi:hypothetical protein